MSKAVINIPGIKYNESGNFFLIAGLCLVESKEIIFETAEHLIKLSEMDSLLKKLVALKKTINSF